MRQLQAQHGPLGKVNGIAPIAKGGTGATTPEEAAVNLKAVPLSKIGQPGGPIQADSQGHLPIELLVATGKVIGYTIEGPDHLVNGEMSIYRFTNWETGAAVSVSVSAGTVEQVDDELHITAPSTGTSVQLTVADRVITLPVAPLGARAPIIITPTEGSENPAAVTFSTAPFAMASETYSDWTSVTAAGTTSVSIPSTAIAIEIEGRKGDLGQAYMLVAGRNCQLGVSTARRREAFTGQSTLSLILSGTGTMKYRWVYSSATHVSTDWQVATDSSFTNIVKQSLADTVNKTQWSTQLTNGNYFVRARFTASISV